MFSDENGFGRGFRGWWGHPQLTAAQQQAIAACDAARRQLDSQIEQWSAQVDSAALAGTPTPPSPPAIATAYAAYLSAIAAKKAADTAATTTAATPAAAATTPAAAAA